jgi:cyclic-di-AMP phosphodiesterase PgpH
MFPKGESIESEVSEGSIWIYDDLIAPFSFAVLKDPEIYKTELKLAERSVYPVFIRDESLAQSMMDSLRSFNNFLQQVIDSSLKNNIDIDNPSFLSSSSFNTIKNIRRQERNLTGRSVTFKLLSGTIESNIEQAYKRGIYRSQPGITPEDSIAVRIQNIDNIEVLSNYQTLTEAVKSSEESVNKTELNDDIKDALKEYIDHFLIANLLYSSEMTAEEIQQAQENVSRYSGIVNENERIVGKHDRITKETKLKIDSYRIAKGEKIGEEGMILQFVGKTLHIGFLISLFTIYLYLFRKKIFHNNLYLVLIVFNLILLCFFAFLINKMSVTTPMHYLIFIPAASMLLTIIFDSRVGFYSTVIFALIVGALRGNDYVFAATNIFAGALAVYTVRDIKNRSQIFRSFLFILLGYFISILAFGLERFAAPDVILMEFAFTGTNALISPILTYGLLIFFERLFRITTDLTLLELSNFDRPLLKDLARKAPGTFNHSMTMGTLAEAAAEKVGANPLLARVGAYYHDIGKTITPQNFVENQLNNRNIHEDLTPEQSISLIIKHVNEGIELAKEHLLPQEIIDFIPMHHGTSVIPFFYDKAKKMYGEGNVNIEDYKYPGPKPASKETAIVMLADGCESAVRSIENPDAVKVENIIDKIISDRIETGQLDESPLTFSDMTKIKESFISILLGQHHRRIRYPKQEEVEMGINNKKKADEDIS